MGRFVPEPLPISHDPLSGYKPKHRGRLHQIAFFLSIPAGVALVIAAANSLDARIAAAIYALSLTGLFATSAVYNRLVGTPRLRPWMRWVDHAMIYVLIAGSYTPVCWLALPRKWSVPVLSIIWISALGGVILKLTSLKKYRRIGGALYLTMGWLCVIILPQLFERLDRWSAVFLALGGVIYMVGAIGLWLRKPNPTPDFGYHEVWHGCVVAAGSCHFVMTWIILVRF